MGRIRYLKPDFFKERFEELTQKKDKKTMPKENKN